MPIDPKKSDEFAPTNKTGGVRFFILGDSPETPELEQRLPPAECSVNSASISKKVTQKNSIDDNEDVFLNNTSDIPLNCLTRPGCRKIFFSDPPSTIIHAARTIKDKVR